MKFNYICANCRRGVETTDRDLAQWANYSGNGSCSRTCEKILIHRA